MLHNTPTDDLKCECELACSPAPGIRAITPAVIVSILIAIYPPVVCLLWSWADLHACVPCFMTLLLYTCIPVIVVLLPVSWILAVVEIVRSSRTSRHHVYAGWICLCGSILLTVSTGPRVLRFALHDLCSFVGLLMM